MSTFVPEKRHLREALLFLLHLNKKAHQMLAQVYGDAAPSIRTYQEWFQRFKSGDFDVKDKDQSGQPKKFKDDELQALLDEDSAQTQEQLTESLGVPYELTERNKQ